MVEHPSLEARGITSWQGWHSVKDAAVALTATERRNKRRKEGRYILGSGNEESESV